ncbi:MAG: hypothetical protein AAGB16_03225 [Pseudomonadota bacterium]
MSGENLPEDETPITPVEYWMESVAAWRDFSRDAGSLWMERMSKFQPIAPSETDPTEDTVTTDLLRMMSDLNLRHWQNMARLLSGMPAWTHLPSTTAGSALVDWFDRMQRDSMVMTASFERVDSDPTVAMEPVKRPLSLTAPEGTPDDLTRIKGIGPKLSAKLNELGIYHFRQIAHWDEDEAAWVDDYLSFKGRVGREQWIAQAQSLSANGAGSLH